jgi:phosphoglycerate dehydrogenase-like enzyme
MDQGGDGLVATPGIAFFCNYPELLASVYPESRVRRLESLGRLYPEIVGRDNIKQMLPELAHIEYIFSTWGMPRLGPEDLSKLPNLRAVFYGAGTVKYFAEPMLQNGIRVISAWAANAIPVAEFTVAQISLATKGFFYTSRKLHEQGSKAWAQSQMPGNYDITVSILGAGMVGSNVIGRLASFDVDVQVFDPYLSEHDAERMGVTKVGLEQAFKDGFVVSNHLANVVETEKMLTEHLFASMQPNSIFINTGRGATVDEAAMVKVLKQRPDITALLDVTDPEPPLEDSELCKLPNVWLSPHIAGSIGNEVVRMADTVIEEFERELKGESLRYEVTLEQLASMA